MPRQDPFTMPDNKTLLAFLEALFEHSLPISLKWYTYFYLALRVTLFSVIAGLVVLLTKRRKFWLFRMVKVPKGTIICPNACEALLAFALLFYVCDSLYRAFSIHWFWNDSSPQTNVILFNGLRLFPLWIAGFVHAIAIGFLGPVSPARMNPHLYHIFLFGAPVALMVTTLFSLVPANTANNAANQLFQKIRVDLAAKPGDDQISIDDLATLFEISNYEKKMFGHFRNWATTGAVFNASLMLMQAVAGTTLTFKIYSALRRQNKQSRSAGLAEDNERGINDGSGSKKHTATLSAASTCVESDSDSLEEPTEKSRRNVLLEFLIFKAAETLCLVAIGAIMLGSIVYMTTRLIADQQHKHNLHLYREKLIDVGYTYQMIEMGAVLVFGTPLMIMILYRQCFPVKVELKKDVKKEWQNVASGPQRPSASNGFISIDTSRPVTPLPNQSEWQAVSPISPISPFEQKTMPFAMAARESGSNHTVQKQNSQELARDACAFAGMGGVGRSIILDALDTANKYPRRRRRTSPWEVMPSQTGAYVEMDPASSTHLYATPHGAVESVPMSPIAAPAESYSRR